MNLLGTLALAATAAGNGNTQAVAWEFVVTREGATSVDSAESETARGGLAVNVIEC